MLLVFSILNREDIGEIPVVISFTPWEGACSTLIPGTLIFFFMVIFTKHVTLSPRNSITLSTNFLKDQAAGKNLTISWEFLKTHIPTFNPVTGVCKLCIGEKFTIVFKPEIATLNSRNGIFSACRHKKAELLVPPDPKSLGG